MLFVGIPLNLICSLMQVIGGRRGNCPINTFDGTRKVAANYGSRWDCFRHRQYEKALGTDLNFLFKFHFTSSDCKLDLSLCTFKTDSFFFLCQSDVPCHWAVTYFQGNWLPVVGPVQTDSNILWAIHLPAKVRWVRHCCKVDCLELIKCWGCVPGAS